MHTISLVVGCALSCRLSSLSGIEEGMWWQMKECNMSPPYVFGFILPCGQCQRRCHFGFLSMFAVSVPLPPPHVTPHEHGSCVTPVSLSWQLSCLLSFVFRCFFSFPPACRVWLCEPFQGALELVASPDLPLSEIPFPALECARVPPFFVVELWSLSWLDEMGTGYKTLFFCLLQSGGTGRPVLLTKHSILVMAVSIQSYLV